MIDDRRAGAGRRVGRQGLARAVGHARSTSATRPTGSTSGSASATTATRRASYARAFAAARGAHAARGRPPDDYGFDIPTGGHAPPRGVPCSALRAVEAPPVQPGGASTAATTSSPPATTSTTRRPCCSATCCGGTTDYLGRQLPVLPARDGLRPQGQAAGAAWASGRRRPTACCAASTTSSRSARWPRATGTSGTRRRSTPSRTSRRARSTTSTSASSHRAAELFARRGRRRAGRAAAVRALRRADHRRGVRVLPAGRAGRATPGPSARVVAGDATSATPPSMRAGPSAPASGCCSIDSQGAALPGHPGRGRRVPHPRRASCAHAEIIGQRRGRRRALDRRARVHGGPPDPGRLRAQDAPRRAGDLPEGPRPDPACWPTSSPGPGSSSPGSARARCR